MTTSKKIGRLTLLKYCIISLAVILAIPIFIGLTYKIFTDEPMSILTFFNSLLNDLDDNEVFVLIQVFVILTGIWFIGGKIGQLIIDRDSTMFLIGGLTFFLLWTLLFISSTLTASIENMITWGQKGFGSVVIGWVIYGLFLFLVFGVVHGLTVGYFLGREIKRKGEKIKTRQQSQV